MKRKPAEETLFNRKVFRERILKLKLSSPQWDNFFTMESAQEFADRANEQMSRLRIIPKRVWKSKLGMRNIACQIDLQYGKKFNRSQWKLLIYENTKRELKCCGRGYEIKNESMIEKLKVVQKMLIEKNVSSMLITQKQNANK